LIDSKSDFDCIFLCIYTTKNIKKFSRYIKKNSRWQDISPRFINIFLTFHNN
jgi:hypothetical protein